jgi:hypothetical protein
MLKIVLYKLPDILFRAAIIFRGDIGQLRLQLRAKIHFHNESLGSKK